MKILVISSPDPIRQANVKKQFSSQNGDWKDSYELVPAVMDKGMVRRGISRSHKKCVQLAKDRGWSHCIVAEDDLDFISPDSLRIFNHLRLGTPNDCQIFSAGLHSGTIVTPDTKVGYSEVIGEFSGLHLYYIGWKDYNLFLSADENYNIDYFIGQELKMKIYVAYPILVKEIPGYSFNAGKETNYSNLLCKKYRCI